MNIIFCWKDNYYIIKSFKKKIIVNIEAIYLFSNHFTSKNNTLFISLIFLCINQ